METQAPRGLLDVPPLKRSSKCLISWDRLEGRGSQERRATKANQDVPLTVLDPQASVGALGPRAPLDRKDHGKSSSKGLQVGEEGQAVPAQRGPKVIMEHASAALILHLGHRALPVNPVTLG